MSRSSHLRNNVTSFSIVSGLFCTCYIRYCTPFVELRSVHPVLRGPYSHPSLPPLPAAAVKFVAHTASNTQFQDVARTSNSNARRPTTWARFTCPYHGALRVIGDSLPLQAAARQGNHDGTSGLGGKEKSRLFLVLSDPRESMCSPCTITVKLGTDIRVPGSSEVCSTGSSCDRCIF